MALDEQERQELERNLELKQFYLSSEFNPGSSHRRLLSGRDKLPTVTTLYGCAHQLSRDKLRNQGLTGFAFRDVLHDVIRFFSPAEAG